jgi:hyperosmotically inducible protein
MKRPLQIILGATAITAFAYPAPAQDTTKPKAARPDYSQHETAQERRADRLNGAAKASDLIGITVNNDQNEKLGTVEDLAVDVESGRVTQVILSTGGLLGVGDILTAVPPGALHHDVTNKVLHLAADKERLKSSPRFEMSKWAECCDSNHLAAVYHHYDQEPAFRFIHEGNIPLDGKRKPIGQRNPETASNTDGTRTTDGTWNHDRRSADHQTMIPAERLGKSQRASKLMGMAVKNRQDEKLGDVDNLLVDLAAGRIVAVVVSSGGFLGMADALSAVPPTALSFNPERDTLLLNTSKEALASAPHFKANQWPDFSQASYSSGVYRAYQVEPYFATDAQADADNSRRNARDRNDQTLTPLDQGNSQADVATTAQIRKEIMAGANLSVNAQNVKVITKNGQVTLRGPVNSPEEKRIIGDIANRIAQAANVSNQLEVKVTTTSTN